MEDIRACIREMLVEKKGGETNVRSRKKQKETHELVNLVSSINYDRPGGEKWARPKLFGR